MIRIATLIFLFLFTSLCLAETVYVNDTLRVGVRAEANSDGAPYAVVVTGMRLEVLDRANGYVKIRSDKGVQGWIKDDYVTASKPAKLELSDLQTEQQQLQAKLAEQDTALKEESAKSAAMSTEIKKLKTENSQLHARLSSSMADNTSNRSVGYLLYVIWLILLAVGGFVAGVLWYRKQAMKRLGCLRV